MSGDDLANPLILRFTSVVFGVLASPFLLNATINHHIEGYREVDPTFFDKFLSSIYVDDVSFSSPDVKSMYRLYQKSTECLSRAGFKLRKFVTNSIELRELIQDNVVTTTPTTDQSYAKISLGSNQCSAPGYHKILGIQWDFMNDEFVFDISLSEPTKRMVVCGMIL